MCLMLPPVSWHRKAGLEPYLFVVGLLAGLAPVGNRQSWRFQTSQQQQSSSIRVVSVRPIIPGLECLLKRREVRWRHGGDIHIEPADIDLTMFSSALRKPFRFIRRTWRKLLLAFAGDMLAPGLRAAIVVIQRRCAPIEISRRGSDCKVINTS